MTARFNPLGLTLAALLAIAALAAPAAQASPAYLWADSYPAAVSAEGTSEEQVLQGFAKVTCETLQAEATLAEQSGSLALQEVQYGGCHTTSLKLPTAIDMNGCELALKTGTRTGEGKSLGSLQIQGCAGEASGITITVKDSEAKEVVCSIEIPEQSAEGVSFAESKGGDVAVSLETPKSLEESHAGTYCGLAEGEMSYTGQVALSAENEASEGVDLHVGEEPVEADFYAEEYPALIEIADPGNQTFTTSVGKVICESVSGHAVQSEQSESILMTKLAYSGSSGANEEECYATTELHFPSVVDTNGCEYRLTAGTTAAPGESEGTLGIQGCNDESGLRISTTNLTETMIVCTIEIPEQVVSGAVFEERGDGTIEVVVATPQEVFETHWGSWCGETGEEEPIEGLAEYEGSFSLSAENEEEEPIGIGLIDTG